ncbi:MAG: tetratricopeptide repeat protein [Pseudomonadota bacterium]
MSHLKALLVASALIITPAASAQVFVIGNGLGGECYQKTKQTSTSFMQADEICTRALREGTMTRGNRAATYTNRGVLRMRNGRYEAALKDYDDALRLDPDLGAAYLNQGAALIYMKDFTNAIGPLDQAIALESADLFAAYYNRAIARENTDDIPGAYQDFQEALRLKPGWTLAQQQLSRFVVQPAEG